MTSSRGPIVAVGAVVVEDGALLMIKRGRAPSKGLWSVPGGRVGRGESLSDALRREVREETGLEIDVGGLLGVLEWRGEEHFVILDYSGVRRSDEPPAAAGDAEEVRWVPLDDVPSLDCTPRFVETLRGWGVLPDPDPNQSNPHSFEE